MTEPETARTAQAGAIAPERLACLAALEKKILWLAAWTIHNANHVRESRDGLKVGGHQASCASLVTLMTALYLDVLRPQDRVAVELNRRIIRRGAWEETALEAGASVEIVHFVGGG